MRVLFVSSHFYPDYKGGGCYNRMLMFVEALKEVIDLDMLFYVSPDIDISSTAIRAYEASLRNNWHPKINLFLCPQAALNRHSKWNLVKGIWNFYQQPEIASVSSIEQVQAFESCVVEDTNMVFVHRLASMCPVMLSHKLLPPIFFDLDDIEHKKLSRLIRQPPRSLLTSLHYLRVPSMQWGESKAIRLAHSTFVCSKEDRAYLTNQLNLPGVVTISNSVFIPPVQPLTAEPVLLFLGTYGYLPNINAANFLIDEVFPLVREKLPNARLIIAGGEPQTIRSYGQYLPGVEITGFVDDLENLYRHVRVVCCPIYAGGGTRVKLIEAAAYGKPIISSKIGAEGLEMKDGRDFLQRESAKSFAEACLKLLNNYSLCEQLGANARRLAIQRYKRSNIVKLVHHHIIGSVPKEVTTD